MALIGTFTMLSSFLNCEHAMYRRYIKKDLGAYVQSKEAKWGEDIHVAMQRRIGSKVPLPDNMRQWEPFAVPFDCKIPLIEQQLAITREGKSTGFWDKDAWFRGKADLVLAEGERAYFLDWKSGSSKYEDPFELETGALLLKAKRPQLKHIVGSYAWLKEDRIGTLYDLSDFDATWARVKELMGQIETKKPEEFAKHKSGLCGWCSVKDCENHYVARK